MGKIKVHEKALAHLSRGLYRSPASALRELVSNAWDANAKVVQISTNYPHFYQISVEDNGEGFTKQDFENLMEGGIGNSEKRSEQKPLINNRPIIGRLGIGMLGIAQICGSFTIISKPFKGEGFRAHIRLYDLLKERLDKDDETIVKEVEVDIGEYSFDEYKPSDYKQGTLIITDDVHPTFVRSFQKSLQFETFKQPLFDWSKALKIVSSEVSLQELGDYWKLLWELSASCPVPYINDRALPDKLIVDEQEKLVSYDFKVIVDGIQLFKPVQLKGNPGGYTTKKIDIQRRKVYERDLVFHGYIVVQDGRSIRPDELRGILIRIKNVSIGYYDPSMLDYRFNEGPRSRWLTGEIFVDEGLEDALNIDRDSFNRFHPQFREVQKYVHDVLHDEIFPSVYKKIEVRSQKRESSREEQRAQRLQQVLSQIAQKPVIVKFRKETKQTSDGQLPKVDIVDKTRNMEVVLPKADDLKTKKTHRQLAAATFAIYEIAMQEKTRDKQRKVFAQLLLELLAQW